MNGTYSAVYRDASGEEATIIHNDGTDLTMTIRGIRFTSQFFEDWEVQERAENDLSLVSFTLLGTRLLVQQGEAWLLTLCDCVLEWQMPVPVWDNGNVTTALLYGKLELGPPRLPERGGLEFIFLMLTLGYNDRQYGGEKTSGYFETALNQIGASLPPSVYLKTCFTCGLSDYSVFGNSTFGTLLCFRGCKNEYRAVRHARFRKDEYMTVMDMYTEMVQETYLCPEWERREPDTGYRG